MWRKGKDKTKKHKKSGKGVIILLGVIGLLLFIIVSACMYIKTVGFSSASMQELEFESLRAIAADYLESKDDQMENAYETSFLRESSVILDASVDGIKVSGEDTYLDVSPYYQKLLDSSNAEDIFFADTDDDVLSLITSKFLTVGDKDFMSREDYQRLVKSADEKADTIDVTAIDNSGMDLIATIETLDNHYYFAKRVKKSGDYSLYQIVKFAVPVFGSSSKVAGLNKSLIAEAASAKYDPLYFFIYDRTDEELVYSSVSNDGPVNFSNIPDFLFGLYDNADDIDNYKPVESLEELDALEEPYPVYVNYDGSKYSSVGYLFRVKTETGRIIDVVSVIEFSDKSLFTSMSAAALVADYIFLVSVMMILICLRQCRLNSDTYKKNVLYSSSIVALISVVFVLVVFLATTLMQLTLTYNRAVNSHQMLEKKIEQIKEIKEDAVMYYEYEDVCALLSEACHIENKDECFDDSGTRNQHYAQTASGEYVVRQDKYGNPVECFSGCELLSNELSVMNAGRLIVVNDLGYSIASSDETNWVYDINSLDDSEEYRDVMFGKDMYLYKIYTAKDGGFSYMTMAVPIDIYQYSTDRGTTRYLSYYEYIEALAKLERIAGEDEGLKYGAVDILEQEGYAVNGEVVDTTKEADFAEADTSAVAELSRSELESVKAVKGLLIAEMYECPRIYSIIDEYYNDIIKSICDTIRCDYIEYSVTEDGSFSEPTIYTREEYYGNSPTSGITVPEQMGDRVYFNFFKTVSKNRMYVHMGHDNKNSKYYALVFNCNDIYSHRLDDVKYYSKMAIGFYFLLTASILLIGWGTYRKKQVNTEGSDNKNEIIPEFDDLEEADNSHKLITKAEGLLGEIQSEAVQKSIENGSLIFYLIVDILVIVATAFIIINTFGNGDADKQFLFANIYSSEWQRCFNGYNISAIVIIVVLISASAKFINRILEAFVIPLGKRAATYSKLILSCVKYVCIFGGILIGAYLMGMEVKSIGTMASVLAGVIGLGSQQLISDISAGLSMFAEGKHTVGSNVKVETYGEFSGFIKEIGIRYTTIQDENGNIKMIPNSEMNKVIRKAD